MLSHVDDPLALAIQTVVTTITTHPAPGNTSVLFCTQGTYPYFGGGVSTWCDLLCKHLPHIDYTLYAVSGTPQSTPKYALPSNVKAVINVPLWGALAPMARQAVTPHIIEAEFVPSFRRLIGAIFSGTLPDVARVGRALYRLWQYFQRYDHLSTWRSEGTWGAFVQEITRQVEFLRPSLLPAEIPTLYDLAASLRTMAHYLVPLAVPLPHVDLVHSTVAGFAGLVGIIAKHVHNTPYVVTEHGVFIREQYIAISSEPTFSPFMKRFLIGLSNLVCHLNYHYADMITTVAAFNRRWQARYGVDMSKTQVIYNGIDTDLFVPRPKPPRTANRPTVVAAARVIPIKDIETMIRSAAVVHAQVPDVLYLVFGATEDDPAYMAKCRALITQLGLENHFEFAGAQTKPPDIHIHGDIGILSSISEGIPYAMLEAMACERPFAATDVGGVREALEDCGFTAAPRDPHGLGEAVLRLLLNDELRLRMGRLARRKVVDRFQVGRSIDQYRLLYESTLRLHKNA